MKAQQINDLIAHLLAIKEFAKDIHYTVHGESFYGKHLFADRIQENMDDYMDSLKEDLLLGNDTRPLESKEYLKMAVGLLPKEVATEDDKTNFDFMGDLLTSTLQLIKSLSDLSMGDENLIGEIAQNLQNSKGLLNLQVEND